MNKLLWFSLFILVCGCTNSDRDKSQTASSKTEYRGLVIDPAIKDKVPKKHGVPKKHHDPSSFSDDPSSFSFAALDIKMFENDKPVKRPFITGSSMPCYAAAHHLNDTLNMTFVPIMSFFGFYVQKYKDSCWVNYVFSMHEETTGPYRLHPGDSITRPGLIVPCRFTVILDKPVYKSGDIVYGFVEGVSDNYYIKTDSVDTKARLEFKGYFRAPVNDNASIVQ